MNYIQLIIEAIETEQEKLIAAFVDLEPTGFEQKETQLIVYFESPEFNDQSVSELLDGFTYRKNKVEEKNWNEEWERNFHPIVIDNFCAVRAHFHPPITIVEHEIIITPKMSFGTGHHATTYMMMQQMEHLNFEKKSVFDFGTGTGILAILSEKLGASVVTAIDIDEWSIENAKENLLRNECTAVTVEQSSKVPEHQYAIILANINKNILLGYVKELTNALKEGGHLVLSGLLIADEEEIVASYATSHLVVVNRLQKDGWISLCFVNGNVAF